MKQKQQEIWDELSDNVKKKIIDRYTEYKTRGSDLIEHDADALTIMEDLFGLDNLNENIFKTWKDVVSKVPHEKIEIGRFRTDDLPSMKADYITVGNSFYRMILRAAAMLKIARLIEIGYGGLVSENEWDSSDYKWHIVYDTLKKEYFIFWDVSHKDPLSFHTEEQAIEFLENNKDLLDDYFMV